MRRAAAAAPDLSQLIREKDLLTFPPTAREAQAANARYYPLPGGYTARVWDDRRAHTAISRVDFCDVHGQRQTPPPFRIRAGIDKEQVLGDDEGVTIVHPYGGAYGFWKHDELEGPPLLVVSYHQAVASLITETHGEVWRPTQ